MKTQSAKKAVQVKTKISALYKQGIDAFKEWFDEFMTEHFGGREVYSKTLCKKGILYIYNGVIRFKPYPERGKDYVKEETFYDAREWLLYDYKVDTFDDIEMYIVNSFQKVS